MKFLIQVVQNASVKVDDKLIGAIDKGFLVFVGISNQDNEEIADKMIKKLVGLRIFADSEEKTNLSINDVNGSMLVISQFTLYADCKKGNRPSFVKSGSFDHANNLYEYVKKHIADDYNINVECGIFGADMKVSLLNDGPFTIMLDSEEIF